MTYSLKSIRIGSVRNACSTMNLTEKEPDRSGESFPLTSLRLRVVIETHRLALEDPLRSTLTFLGVALLAVLPFVDLPRLRRSGLGLESHDIAPFSEAAAAFPHTRCAISAAGFPTRGDYMNRSFR